MPKLYVANCTVQRHLFLFREPESGIERLESIPAGGQVDIPAPRGQSEWQPEQIRGVVKQHEMYGLVHVRELRNKKTFTGMCYSDTVPVSLDDFGAAIETNEDAQERAAADRRRAQAQHIVKGIQERTGLTPDRLEVELVEETKGKPSEFREGTEVVKEGVQPRHRETSKRGGGRH